MGTTLISPVKEDVFSLDDIESSISKLTNRKAKGIEGNQVEILKIRRYNLIPYQHKLLNLSVMHGFPSLWTQSLIVPIFKNGDKNAPSNYKTFIISHILAKL